MFGGAGARVQGPQGGCQRGRQEQEGAQHEAIAHSWGMVDSRRDVQRAFHHGSTPFRADPRVIPLTSQHQAGTEGSLPTAAEGYAHTCMAQITWPPLQGGAHVGHLSRAVLRQSPHGPRDGLAAPHDVVGAGGTPPAGRGESGMWCASCGARAYICCWRRAAGAWAGGRADHRSTTQAMYAVCCVVRCAVVCCVAAGTPVAGDSTQHALLAG